MASDTAFLNSILKHCSRGTTRLFRHSIGLGWVGKTIRVSRPEHVLMVPGDVLVKKARALHAGLFKGAGDILGWETIEITPEMVGRKVAVFVSMEGKEGAGRSEPDQVNWREQVRNAGGIAGEVRSIEDAQRLLGK